MSSLNIVGWKLSKTGVEVNPDKLQAIHDYQFPLSKKAMQRSLAMANQYRIHIPMYAHIAKSLSALTKNAVPVNWTLAKVPGEAIAAFAQLKKALMAPPVLGILDPKEKYLPGNSETLDFLEIERQLQRKPRRRSSENVDFC